MSENYVIGILLLSEPSAIPSISLETQEREKQASWNSVVYQKFMGFTPSKLKKLVWQIELCSTSKYGKLEFKTIFECDVLLIIHEFSAFKNELSQNLS